MNFIRLFVPENRYLLHLFGVISISLLLNGCAVMAGIPAPLKIASNIHSAYTLYKNLDDDTENDSWYVSYLKSFFAKDKKDEQIFTIADKDEPKTVNSNASLEIKL